MGPREQDKFNLGFDDVCQLLCPLLQAVCGQLLLEAQDAQETAIREGCHEVCEPKVHSSHRRRRQRGRDGKARAVGRRESTEKTELSGLHVRAWVVPAMRGMITFALRRLSVSVQDYSFLRIHVQPQSCQAGTQRGPCTASACQRSVWEHTCICRGPNRGSLACGLYGSCDHGRGPLNPETLTEPTLGVWHPKALLQQI